MQQEAAAAGTGHRDVNADDIEVGVVVAAGVDDIDGNDDDGASRTTSKSRFNSWH